MDVSHFDPLLGYVDPDESLRAACLHVLDTVQDVVAEATADPWPGTRIMPEPSVEVTAETVTLGYRTSDEIVLELPPIQRR
jgi:hypothetical protein